MSTSQCAITVNYTCNVCQKPFSTEEEVKQHCYDKHISLTYTFTCKVCKSLFTTNNQFEQHFHDKHEAFSCKVVHCNFIGNSAEGLIKHISANHLPVISVYTECPDCSMMWININSLVQHAYDAHGLEIDPEEDELDTTIKIQCKICPQYECTNKDTFGRHMSNKHPDVMLKCAYNCSFVTNKFWEFITHLQDHLSEETEYNVCPGCHLGFVKESSLFQHYRDKQNSRDSNHYYDMGEYSTFSKITCTLCDHEYEEESEDEDFESDFLKHINSAHGFSFSPDAIDL